MIVDFVFDGCGVVVVVRVIEILIVDCSVVDCSDMKLEMSL